MTNTKITKFDLEERTAKFGEAIIDLVKKVHRNEITKPIINQLVKCATSIGANYCEADDAESKKDFKHKIGICKKESRETKHFLRMLSRAMPEMRHEIIIHWQEAKELNLIFNSIYIKVK
ncbi:MAG: hypothetical protein UY48_C0052G0002 [Candidatus Gottesmanbacteria bacterium GW2011_GWB1_49_7]|uniref:Four helix bundle protein n=1 Tax=Candidatus Gottesmanbacteria bacterium GW2011_GWB1_49_7 TaxID=1618448 RepID=A0A0G1VTK0_9BACT|nr:MAG: hypothetical protein UY48_C0052G0002 [Candidatus Gottesmanbacteria bacterium GW2011_GWB1_49_7]